MKLDARPTAAPAAPPPLPRVAVAPPRRSRWQQRKLVIGAACLVLVLVAIGAVVLARSATPPTEIPAAPAAERIVARGAVRPVAQARVSTLDGGIIRELFVVAGDPIDEQQEIARVRGPQATEILTAPFRGTVTDVLVHVGDTVTPGTVVATIGDVSRLQVETLDVDEFIVGQLHRGQVVTLTVEALNRRQLQGVVRSIALLPRTNTVGDEHYPVVIGLTSWPPELRPGMTARITFAE